MTPVLSIISLMLGTIGSVEDDTRPVDWLALTGQMNLSQPPDHQVDLGYTGLWRAIYGGRDRKDRDARSLRSPLNDRANGLGGANGVTASDPDRRAPRLHAAREVIRSQRFRVAGPDPGIILPVAGRYARGDSREGATFVWDHRLQQVTDHWSLDAYVMAPTSSSRVYANAPTEAVREDRDEPQQADFVKTLLLAGIAVVLLVVVLLMPK